MNDDDKKKLTALLDYWVEHNAEHGEEFREWADRAREPEDSAVREELLDAVGFMTKQNDSLVRARQKLGDSA